MTLVRRSDACPLRLPPQRSMMSTDAQPGFPPLLRRPGDARTLNAAGVTLRFLLTAEDTGGQFALLEYTAPAGFAGPQPHWHQHTTEVFYGLEGSVLMRMGEETHPLNPGELVLVPPGVVHGFQNPGTEPARFLVQVSPGGLEGYFVELVEMMENASSWPLPDMRPVAALAQRYDTHPPSPPRT